MRYEWIDEYLLNKIDNIASQTGRSRNELINIFLDYALNNYEIVTE